MLELQDDCKCAAVHQRTCYAGVVPSPDPTPDPITVWQGAEQRWAGRDGLPGGHGLQVRSLHSRPGAAPGPPAPYRARRPTRPTAAPCLAHCHLLFVCSSTGRAGSDWQPLAHCPSGKDLLLRARRSDMRHVTWRNVQIDAASPPCSAAGAAVHAQPQLRVLRRQHGPPALQPAGLPVPRAGKDHPLAFLSRFTLDSGFLLAPAYLNTIRAVRYQVNTQTKHMDVDAAARLAAGS